MTATTVHVPENRKKTPVRVIAEIDEQGNQRPLRIKWQNCEYVVDRILGVKKSFPFCTGVIADCYMIEIGGKVSYLFLEGKRRWFVGEKCEQQLGYPTASTTPCSSPPSAPTPPWWRGTGPGRRNSAGR